MKYLFFDGDNVGITIEKSLMSGDIISAQKVSSGINEAIELIKTYLKSLKDVEILLIGGDDILIKIKSNIEDNQLIQEISNIFLLHTGLTISCGVGKDIKESIFNLHLAKLFGKNQTKR